MPFVPLAPPTRPEGLPQYLQQELARLAEYLEGAKDYVDYKVRHSVPTKVKEGRTYAADGTSWNPGNGAGVYAYIGGSFVTMSFTSPLSAAMGGTGITSYAVGDTLYASAATTLSKLAAVATGNALISGGVTTAPSWGKIGLTTHVSGTLGVASGGTNLVSYAVGDLLYASGATTIAKLAGVATGNVLISGGVTTAPSYGKVGLTTHVSGTLGVTSGGTGLSTVAANTVLWGSAADTVAALALAANTFAARSSTGNVAAKTITDFALTVLDDTTGPAVCTTIGALQNIVEDTTPELGGDLDANGNDITDLGDVTFKTGAAGGTLRTGTSAADKFQLQAYDVNSGVYRKVMEADAGNDVTLEVFADSFMIWDSTDETKQLKFLLSGGTTGVTTTIAHSPTANRTITFPDATVTLASLSGTEVFTNKTLTSPTINGGTITGITDLTVADGGTGASTAAGARTNLGLGTAAVENIGTSGATVPLLSTANTWTTDQVFTTRWGVGSVSGLSRAEVTASITGGVTSGGFRVTSTVQSDVTTGADGMRCTLSTQATAFTLPSLRHFHAVQGTIGAGSTVTSQFGFIASSTLTGATNNYGFYGDLNESAGDWNFYADGDAANYFRGKTTYGDVFGYGTLTGVGSSVTQATSKSTGVTTNRCTGEITMNAAALAATTAVSFTLTSNDIEANDTIIVHRKSGGTAGAYQVWVDSVAAGSCVIRVLNTTAGSLSEAVVLQYCVIRGAIA